MLLRTKIFRQSAFFALIPSLIIAAVAYYFLLRTISQTSEWLSASSPDRTINSLRLIESRLQLTAQNNLYQTREAKQLDSLLDWWIEYEDSVIIDFGPARNFPIKPESLGQAMSAAPGLIRRMIDDQLVLGAVINRNSRFIAGGYLLGREYLRGFEAAGASLSDSRGFKNVLPGFLLFIIVSGITVLLLVVLAAYFLSRRLSASVTTPLERLTDVTAAMAGGSAPGKINIASGTNEITRLAETFKRMMADLEQNRKRLVAAERVAAWQEFARRMAHELKNPLTPISLSLYRVKKNLIDSGHYERFAESIEAISAEVAHLERLATDYSSLARLPEPEIRTFDFIRLARDVVELHLAQLEDFKFKNEIADGTLDVEGDPDRLREVMVNLLKNAFDFTIPGGMISVSTTYNDETVSFCVANEGKETVEDDLKAAKMPYFSTRKGGTGLGLAISEKIVIDHGGNLTLQLKDDMTEARFEIPRRQTGGASNN